MLEFLLGLVWLITLIGGIYYFMFGGKEKLGRYLFNKMSLAGKVEKIIKTDFSPKYARAAFYIGNNYHHRMSQADWQKYCNERIDNTLDKNSQEYADAVAPIVNAIVLDDEGFYLRRGMENLDRSLQRFMPGVNDRISLNYFIEPYKYFENKELAAKSLAEEALRKEKYERERPIREAREAERKAAQQQRYQEQRARREEEAARFERQRQERQAAKDARARCSQCVHSGKCSMQARNNSAACGGFRPR